MQEGRRFMRRTNTLKEGIEKRNTRQFVRFYKRIANDLINFAQTEQTINFLNLFQNYQPDYIFLFRNIYQDVKDVGFGFEIRKQLNFNKRNIIEIKQETIPENEQEQVNDAFDLAYSTLLNNRTEELANDQFIASEARYFENIYNNSVQDYVEFTQATQEDLQQTQSKLFALGAATALTAKQKKEQRILRRREEALQDKVTDLQTNRKQEVNKAFKRNLEEKIPIRSQGNTQYATGQATSEVKELEFQTIATIAAIQDRIEKRWWENSQFIFGAEPRDNHLRLSGSTSQNGVFNVGGTLVPRPRDPALPIEESAYCRCEVEYRVT
jgi:hypothetical protein